MNNNDDANLKRKLIARFLNDTVRERKMEELERIRQLPGETIENYVRRFKKILRIATGVAAMADLYQVNLFIRGLNTELIRETKLGNPRNLADAITRAKLEENVDETTSRNRMNNRIQERGMEAMLNEQTEKYQNKPEMTYQQSQRNTENRAIDELTKQMEELKLSMMKIGRQNNIERQNDRRSNIHCNNCGRIGHLRRDCFALKTCNNCGKVGHTERVCRENTQRNERINFMDDYQSDLY